MSLLTQAYLLDKYGPRLNVEQLGEVLGLDSRTVHNQVSAGTFAVRTYVDGKRRFADVRDVAQHFDEIRATAR